jgi:hypothetical protein
MHRRVGGIRISPANLDGNLTGRPARKAGGTIPRRERPTGMWRSFCSGSSWLGCWWGAAGTERAEV